MPDNALQWAQSVDHWLDEFNAAPDPDAVCDVLIIGSGYGGSFAARELAAAGSRVWVMERGREYALGDFPEDIGSLPGHVRLQTSPAADTMGYSDALLDLRRFEDVSVLVANGLGGGSLINAGVALRPDAAMLEQPAWPAYYRTNPAGKTALWSAMNEVEQQLQVAPLTDAKNLKKFKALDALGQSMRLNAEPAPLTIASVDQVSPAGVAQKACTRCGNCFTGCNVGAKNTLVTHVLPDAHRNGARFYTGASAQEVSPHAGTPHTTPQGRAARWTVHMACTEGQNNPDKRREFVVHAHTVILAAGTLGSTEILLKSPTVPTSALLGSRFSTNGDVLAMGWGMRATVNGMAMPGTDTSAAQAADVQVGPTITGILRARVQVPQGGERTVLIEEGAVPSALTQATVALAASLSLPHRYTGKEGPGYFGQDWGTDRLATPADIGQHALLMLAMGPDDADGVMALQAGAKNRKDLNITWPKRDTGPASPYYQAIHQWMLRAAQKPGGGGFQGGDYLPNPLWKALPEDFNEITGDNIRPQGITVHPLGGCPMGDDAATGVVDWRGTVFQRDGGVHAGLHVLDGAMLPSAVGVNPFLTISALSLVAAKAIAADLYASPSAKNPTVGTVRQQDRNPQPRTSGGEPVTLQFREHLQGYWRGPEPEWISKTAPELTANANERGWIVAVDVTLDIDHWVANPSMRLEGAHMRIYRNPYPQDMTVHPDACTGTPVLEGSGWVSLLALDAPRGPLHQIQRILSAFHAFLQRRGWGELFQLATAGKGQPNEGKWASIWRRVKGFCRAARNLSYHRELIYTFELHQPEKPHFKVHTEGRKRLAYTPDAKNVWNALVQIDLNLIPHNGQNAATLSVTADLIDMVRNRRLQVTQAANTPDGIFALIAFSTLWLRAMFQSHFWTFRGMDYDRLQTPPPAEHGLIPLAQTPVRVALQVPRYRNPVGDQSTELLALELTRYQPAKAPSTVRHLLMVHGLAHGGTVFTTHTTEGHNMAAAFVAEGYTVWVLDHRLSNRLPYADNDHCMDDVAALDIPAAVRHVYRAAGQPIAVFAHCVGGGAFAMATLKGWLHDADEQRSMVGKAIIHAVHPWVVPSASNQLSGALSVLYKDFLPEHLSLNPVPPSGSGTAMDQVLDRLSASLTWPESEIDLHLKDQFDPMGGTATCNRMTLFYGREWVHANLSETTHRELASLVGPASIDVFRQLFFIVNRQRLTDRDGASVYMTADQFRQHWTFPVLFAHGSENKVFDPRSAVRSWGQLGKLLPDNTVRVFMAEGYGHMDFLFGKSAHRDVYPHLCDFFDNPAEFKSSPVSGQGQDDAQATPPSPLVGPHIRLHEEKHHDAMRRTLVLWAEFPNDPTRTGAALTLHGTSGAQMADWSATRLQQVHLDPEANREVTLLQGPGAYWTGHLTESHAGAFKTIDTLQLQWGEQGTLGLATLDFKTLHWWKRWTGEPVTETVSWLAMSCRWPGTAFESEAVDAVALHMLDHVKRSTLPVDAMVMLGDQIYADATANLLKTRESDEILAGLYRDAWGSPHARTLLSSVPSYTVVDDHEYGDNWCGCPDPLKDETFINGFEAALAYQSRWSDSHAYKYQSTPCIRGSEVTGFWSAFNVGGIPFFAADTRSERQLRNPTHWLTQTMVGKAQMAELKDWLVEYKDKPKVLCSGVVFGLIERAQFEAPAKCFAGDGWSGYPATWRELVQFIVAKQIHNLVFLSGDYHFSGMAELELQGTGDQPAVRAISVVCSGWNASLPFANSTPRDFVMDEWADYPRSDATVRARCRARPLSTAQRQFSKLSLTQDPHGGWQLTARVYGDTGLELAQRTLAL